MQRKSLELKQFQWHPVGSVFIFGRPLGLTRPDCHAFRASIGLYPLCPLALTSCSHGLHTVSRSLINKYGGLMAACVVLACVILYIVLFG